jgi:hypothetical protein
MRAGMRPRGRSSGGDRGRPVAARRLPVAVAPQVPAVPDDVLYEFGRMDESGRVADRTMVSALGSRAGDHRQPCNACPQKGSRWPGADGARCWA